MVVEGFEKECRRGMDEEVRRERENSGLTVSLICF